MSTDPKTILVVEDEPAVLRVILLALRRSGYHALAARGVADALRICREHPGPIQLALLDVILPDADAFELFEQLRAVRPGLHALYTSGAQPLEAGDFAFIQKPFRPSALVEQIARLIGPPPAPVKVAVPSFYSTRR